MSGNFVRERQRIVYIYNIHIIYVNNTLPLAHEISRHFWAAYGLTRSQINQMNQDTNNKHTKISSTEMRNCLKT